MAHRYRQWPETVYRRLCTCLEQGIRDYCKCNRYYSQPDTDCGYDSSRHRFYYGYDLYVLTAADSKNDLPVFPLLGPGSRHDSFGLCHTYAVMKAFIKDANITEALLDSAHDAMAIYEYCNDNSIASIIRLNERNGVNLKAIQRLLHSWKRRHSVCQAGLKLFRGIEKAVSGSNTAARTVTTRTGSTVITSAPILIMGL